MIKLRQNADKLGKAAHAARLAQIRAAAAEKKHETARAESRAAKQIFKAARKAAKKAKRAARAARKASERAAERVIALRRELERAEKKQSRTAARVAKGPASARAARVALPRTRIAATAPVAPDLGSAGPIIPAEVASNN